MSTKSPETVSTGIESSSQQEDRPDTNKTIDDLNVGCKAEENLDNILKSKEGRGLETDPQPCVGRLFDNGDGRVDASREEDTQSQISNNKSIDIEGPDEVGRDNLTNKSIIGTEENKEVSIEEKTSSPKAKDSEFDPASPTKNTNELTDDNTDIVELEKDTENKMDIEMSEVETFDNVTNDDNCHKTEDSDENNITVVEEECSATTKPNEKVNEPVSVSILSDDDDITVIECEEMNSLKTKVCDEKAGEALESNDSTVEGLEAKENISLSNKEDVGSKDTNLKLEKKMSDINVYDSNKVPSCDENQRSNQEKSLTNVRIKDDSMDIDEKIYKIPKIEEKEFKSVTNPKNFGNSISEIKQENSDTKSQELIEMEIDDEVKTSDNSEIEVEEVPQNKVSTDKTAKKSNSNADNTDEHKESGISSSTDDSEDEMLYKSNFKQLIQSVAEKNEKLRKLYFPDKNEKSDVEVICLEDDEDEVKVIPKPAAAADCINPNCMSGEDLAKPASFVLNYFGLKRSSGQRVCAECFNLVAEHMSKLGNMLINKEPLMTAEFPNFRDVILLDSDEENDSGDEGNLSDDTMSMIRENIDDVIAECMDKVDFNYQIRESSVLLNTKFDKLQEEAKELNERFNAVQNKLDEHRRNIYKHFTQPIKELEEVHLSDCEIPPMPLVRDKEKIQQYNYDLIQSLRRNEQQQREMEERDRQKAYAQRSAANKVSLGYETIQDVVALQSNSRCEPPPNLPPPGTLLRPKLKVGDMVYTMKVSYFSVWVLVKVLEVIPRNPSENDTSTESYRVRFEQLKKVKTVTGKYLAYARPANVQLKVGTRVIAVFKDEESELSCKDNYYVGVIAEPPKSTNKYRYLVFFDDGYTQYCPHDNVLVVVDSSPNVWDDIHPEPRDFIKKYLAEYPERPMVKLSKGQVVKVEWNGKWWIVKVLEVDGSLVQVHFNADNRTEWIYRGSTRLGPMYQERLCAQERRSGIRPSGFGSSASHNKLNKGLPYVEYTRGDGEEKKDEEKDTTAAEPVPVRSVARKSTAKKPPEPIVTNVPYTKPLVNQIPQGTVSQRVFRKALRPLSFSPHQCSNTCVQWTEYSPDRAKMYDPLVKPLMFGFERLTMNYRGRSLIFYRGPCGRMIRHPQEMICYLTGTKSKLTIDMFDFDFWVNVTSEFKEAATFCRIEDLSYGKESVPISCVNELDHSMPQYVEYLTARNPTRGVNLNLDPEFLVCCDCKDDCSNREDCTCWQLTMLGKSYLPDGDMDPVFGYQFRRLSERVATGIYECNSRCACSSSCQNRVAQQPLSCRLQLFKTPKKGWGIRCLHDIPRGAFICIYAGFLLTDQEANEGGKTYGDEYLAELDYIESVEGLKQGYESEAKDMSDVDEDDDDSKYRRSEMKDEEFSQGQASVSSGEGENSMDGEDKSVRGDIRLRLRRRKEDESEKESRRTKHEDDSVSISDDDTETTSRKPQTFDANITKPESEDDEFPSVRDLFGPDERVFIMDAKTHGNIGRYLNHSCSPNVFVQNVFVDTHDLRFPWVAFFASQYIPAGQELTWDYNYDVGSVPGKVMHCYCASANCRGRLL